LGTPVTRKTLLAHLSEESAKNFSESSYYCPNPNCGIAYFDLWGLTAPSASVSRSCYPKNPAAPICSCFKVTADKIRREAEAGRKEFVRDLIAKAESPGAQCETISPSGSSCAVEIRKIFLKHFPSGQQS
jgi:hypothetical protein